MHEPGKVLQNQQMVAAMQANKTGNWSILIGAVSFLNSIQLYWLWNADIAEKTIQES